MKRLVLLVQLELTNGYLRLLSKLAMVLNHSILKDEKAARKATKEYLENMADHHGFTPEEALRAYNWGPGNVINYRKGKRKDIPSEALNYPGKILGIENTQGVTPPPGEEPPLPIARPDSIAGEEQAIPTPRPENLGEEPGVMDFLKKYVLGSKYQMTGGPVYAARR